MKPPTAVLISTGRELLTGRVLDKNANHIAVRLFDIGWQVLRMCQVDDRFDAVCGQLKQAVAEADMVIATGGLGPTYDDGTLGYIGRCLGLPMVMDSQARRMVIQRYSEVSKAGVIRGGDLNKARMKMAVLPDGAVPLPNRVGTAPGVFLEYGRSRVFCLPGPPREMQPMFEEQVLPRIVGITGGRRFVRRSITLNQPDESVLDPLIAKARQRFPGVYFKTAAKGFTTPAMDVYMETWGLPAEATDLLSRAEAFLLELTGHANRI